jgi:serine/threonine protein kinase
VLLLPDETVKLGDFGLSCVAGEESRPGGTIGYMAPEALRKDPRMDYGVDVYGLGFLAYQSLLGGPMFLRLYGTIKAIEWARWVLSREKFRTLAALGAAVTPGLSAIVERMVEKDPRERYARMNEVRKDLERLLGRPIDA